MNPQQLRYVAQLRKQGFRLDRIAADLGVSVSEIKRAMREQYNEAQVVANQKAMRQLRDKQRQERNVKIFAMLDAGHTRAAVARYFGLSANAVYSIAKKGRPISGLDGSPPGGF